MSCSLQVLAYPPEYNFIFENDDETEASKVQRNRVVCPSYEVCANWAKYQKNISILLADKIAEDNYARGVYVGDKSEPLLCRLEDGIVFNTGLTMIIFHGDPLTRRVNEIIDRVVETGLLQLLDFPYHERDQNKFSEDSYRSPT